MSDIIKEYYYNEIYILYTFYIKRRSLAINRFHRKSDKFMRTGLS